MTQSIHAQRVAAALAACAATLLCAFRAEGTDGHPGARGKSERSVAVTPPPLVNDLAWAYAITPGPAAPAPADDGTKLTLPGAEKTFTLDQIRNRMGPADWFPGDHPSMPSVVAIGREQAGIWPCSLATIRTAKGGPRTPASRD